MYVLKGVSSLSNPKIVVQTEIFARNNRARPGSSMGNRDLQVEGSKPGSDDCFACSLCPIIKDTTELSL